MARNMFFILAMDVTKGKNALSVRGKGGQSGPSWFSGRPRHDLPPCAGPDRAEEWRAREAEAMATELPPPDWWRPDATAASADRDLPLAQPPENLGATDELLEPP